MWIFLAVIIVIVLLSYFFVHSVPFGSLAGGERRRKILGSPNYRDGKFQNQHFTPDLTEGSSFFKVFINFIFHKSPRNKPSASLPSVKPDLSTLNREDEDALVWFGHSSYLLRLSGKTVLVDPVLSGHASPVRFTTSSFPGSDVVRAYELPSIDLLILSHDHWDHLDYPTLKELQPRIQTIITGLGTGAHLERWGFRSSQIRELDWNQSIQLDMGFSLHALPARHFSGRGLKRNQVLWCSFLLQTSRRKIFIGGDSGYDDHFKTIGEQFGPIDLAILECGQYNADWKYIHMMPEEVLKAAGELRARNLLPVHWAKFSLAPHAWDEPIQRLLAAAKDSPLKVWHPRIGEIIRLDHPPAFLKWWEEID